MHVETIAYQGWRECYRLTTEYVELIVTAQVGPRILHCSLRDAPNLLYQIADDMGNTGGEAYRFYGGHRLWHAPEEQPRTYQPDNAPVEVTQDADGVHFTAPIEAATGIQKRLSLTMQDNRVTVQHTLMNHNLWEVRLAAWALTMMRSGGTAVLPLPPRGSHEDNLQPMSNLALWAYTDFSDPRWTLGREYILLRQDAARSAPQKLGASHVRWLAYVVEGTAFIKQFDVPATAPPDLNSNAEIFTDDKMLELESLGAYRVIAAGASITHTERWSLHADVDTVTSDSDVQDILKSLII